MHSLCIYDPNQITFGPGNFVKILSSYVKFNSNKSLKECLKSKKLMFIGEHCSIPIALIRRILCKTTIHRLDGRRLIKEKKYQIKLLMLNREYKRLMIYIAIELRVFIVAMLSTKIIFQSEYIKSQWPNFFKTKSIVLMNPGNIELNYFRKKNNSQKIIEKDICKLIYSKGFIGKSRLFDIISRKEFFNTFYLDIFSNRGSLTSSNKSINFFNPIEYDEYLAKLPKYQAFICLEDFPPCPNAVIEAQLCGLPIISLYQGSIPEIVVDPGFLLPKDYLKLSDQIQNEILKEKLIKVINIKQSSKENIANLAYEKFCKYASEAYIKFLN